MNRSIQFVCIIILLTIPINSMTWELGIRVVDNSGNPQSRTVSLYTYSDNSLYRQASSVANSWPFQGPNVNLACDIDDNNTPNASWASIPRGQYRLRVENEYFVIDVPESGNVGDFILEYNINSTSFYLYQNNSIVTLNGPYTWIDHNITVKNSFSGGDLTVDGITYQNVSSAGIPFTWEESTFPHTLQTYEKYIWDSNKQNYFWMRFGNWSGPGNFSSSNLSTQIPVSNGTYTASFLEEYNIVFQNHFCEGGNGGVINVRNSQPNSPTSSFPVTDTITAQAVDQTINGIYYSFDHWSQEGGTNQTYTFHPSNHTTYTAYFIGTPSNYGKYLHNDINYGSPITLHWTDNPDTNVNQYQIWRNKKGGSGPVLLTTVGRGVQTYTDYDYLLDASYTHDLLWYDVREYYSCDGTYSTPDWLAIYGEIAPKVALTLNNNINTSEIKDYSLTCFPNPFNPSTKINFTLPEDQPLKLIIYDVLGREVKELLNYYIPKGSYIVVWDGTNNAGIKVNSGIYFYSLQTPNKTIIEKMILAK